VYILDSSLLIELLQEKPRAAKIMELVGNETAVTTLISVHELFRGAEGKEEFVVKNLLQGMEILLFTSEDAQISGKLAQKLAKKGIPINVADLLIAGICLNNNAKLVTFDNDFKLVPELNIIGI